MPVTAEAAAEPVSSGLQKQKGVQWATPLESSRTEIPSDQVYQVQPRYGGVPDPLFDDQGEEEVLDDEEEPPAELRAAESAEEHSPAAAREDALPSRAQELQKRIERVVNVELEPGALEDLDAEALARLERELGKRVSVKWVATPGSAAPAPRKARSWASQLPAWLQKRVAKHRRHQVEPVSLSSPAASTSPPASPSEGSPSEGQGAEEPLSDEEEMARSAADWHKGDLPGAWTAVTSGDGKQYFWNTETDAVQWKRPLKTRGEDMGAVREA